MNQPCEYLQKFQQNHFLFLEKKVSCLQSTLMTYLQDDDYEDCFSNVLNTIRILRSLEFTIHPEKSKFIPSQCIKFLGFIFNSVQMIITLSLEKKQKILNLCHEVLKEDVVTIRFLSKLSGNLVAAFPAVTLSSFCYRALEMDKAKAPRLSNGN